MSLDNVVEILKSYDDKKGVGRKLFGDHNAIKDLRKFYIKIITPAKPSLFPSTIPKLYYEKKEPLPTSTQTTWFHNFVKEYEFKTNDKGSAYDCFKELKSVPNIYTISQKKQMSGKIITKF